jgi:hypothetical protein
VPCCATGTAAMLASFDGSSNIAGYTADSGAVFTQSSGNTSPDTYQVDGTVLRRQDIGEGSEGLGEAWMYTDQQPATSRYYIEALIRFKGNVNEANSPPDPLYSFLQFYQQADSPGLEDLLAGISSQGLGNDVSFLGTNNFSYTTFPGADYKIRLYVDGTHITLCINGEELADEELDAPPVLPIGIDTFNFSGIDNFEIEDLTIVDV